ncbi:hypothetical protein ACQP1G_42250 [Nocardia sp. CA-107356]|uniref:hypothetical protein n=1 Tax=Nocardia sp. CA-107356 TaxID=3239972 RepID=UPI003D8AEDA6
MGFEYGFLLSFGAFGRDGVGDEFGAVAVAGFADVESCLGVDGVSVPGFLQQFQHVELGDALLDPAGQDLGGSFLFPVTCVFQPERFVGGQEPDPGAFETMFDIGTGVGASGDAFDGLAQHVVETATRFLGFGQQVRDTAVAGHRDVELLVRGGVTAIGKILAPGLHVPEMCGDHSAVGNHESAVAELTRDRQRRVLQIGGGGTARERDPIQHVIGVGSVGRGRQAAFFSCPLSELFWPICHLVISHRIRAC